LPALVLSVVRREGVADFSARDVSALHGAYPLVRAAVLRLLENEHRRFVHEGMAMTIRHRGRGTAVLDRGLRLIEADVVARRICGSWTAHGGRARLRATPHSWRLPPAFAAACREMQREHQAHRPRADVTRSVRRRRILHPHRFGVSASITMICRHDASLVDVSFVIEVEQFERGKSAAVVLDRMTPAERAVAMVLADGLSNQEIADQLGKSVASIKFLLHRIYTKARVPNRAALVAALRAGHAPPQPVPSQAKSSPRLLSSHKNAAIQR
jgi:DNA-binding CsgD family transcriptional regulator